MTNSTKKGRICNNSAFDTNNSVRFGIYFTQETKIYTTIGTFFILPILLSSLKSRHALNTCLNKFKLHNIKRGSFSSKQSFKLRYSQQFLSSQKPQVNSSLPHLGSPWIWQKQQNTQHCTLYTVYSKQNNVSQCTLQNLHSTLCPNCWRDIDTEIFHNSLHKVTLSHRKGNPRPARKKPTGQHGIPFLDDTLVKQIFFIGHS